MREVALRNAKVHSGRLSSLLQAARLNGPIATSPALSPTERLVWGFLAWECSQSRAAKAYERLRRGVVDLNELRVCLTNEIQTLMGDRYPKASKRASRIRRVLRDIHRREIEISIDHLLDVPASDATAYLMGLDGMLPYVASFTCLHALNHPVIPIDQRLHAALVEEGIADADASPEEIGDGIVDHIEPEQCAAVHMTLWGWIDSRDAGDGADQEG